MSVTYHVGDTRDVIATIPDGSVSLVACSPPFLALRSYLPAGHESKHAEIGSEPDPATFIDTLLALTAEWGRVLAPWGSIAIELGDTYAGSGASGWERDAGEFRREARSGASADGRLEQARDLTGWPRAKCLALIPQLYATSLAYGRNLLTGQPSPAGQWLVRNVIVWARPNPAVGALGDKVRPCTSYITVATRSPKRWFDLTAVRGAFSDSTHQAQSIDTAGARARAEQGGRPRIGPQVNTHAGAPPLDCWFDEHDTWTITTQPSRLAHYAMWPPKLAERLILMMCPEWVCATCGEPRRRIERQTERYRAHRLRSTEAGTDMRAERNTLGMGHGGRGSERMDADLLTLGWSDCGHDNYQPGTVLDPFCGTGTSLCVAALHGRDAIGIDLDLRNKELLEARMDECRRSLFGSPARQPNQMEMFAG